MVDNLPGELYGSGRTDERQRGVARRSLGVVRMIPGLQVAVTGPVARVIFDRPEARNALSPEMIKGLGETFRRLEDDADVRCLILTGAGEHFVGGGDVKAFADSLSLSPAERKHRFEERVSASISFLAVLESI